MCAVDDRAYAVVVEDRLVLRVVAVQDQQANVGRI
jgi:hypothetical protein